MLFPAYGSCFNTQPPEGGCLGRDVQLLGSKRFQHTAARRRLHSTSARTSKALRFQHTAARRRLLEHLQALAESMPCFNTQPPEGGCKKNYVMRVWDMVSTHSRPKAAAQLQGGLPLCDAVFQHTAARRRLPSSFPTLRPRGRFQHTAARRRLRPKNGATPPISWFQHTAARRRLPRARALMPSKARFNTQPPEGGCETSA